MLKNFQHRNFIIPFEPLRLPIRNFQLPKSELASERQESFPKGDSGKPRSPRLGIFSQRDPKELVRQLLRLCHSSVKDASRLMTFYVNRAGKKVKSHVLAAQQLLNQMKRINSDRPHISRLPVREPKETGPMSFYSDQSQLNFSRMMPDPNIPLDPEVLSRASIVNKTVMHPILSRNAEVMADALSSYPPELQLAMIDYYLKQTLLSIEKYLWFAGFFETQMDHVSWLASLSDDIAHDADIEHVSDVLSLMRPGRRYF